MNQWVNKFILYAFLFAGSVIGAIFLPLVASEPVGGHYVTTEIKKLKDIRGTTSVDLEDPLIVMIFEEGDRISSQERTRLANINVIVIGAVIFIVGILYKSIKYLDIFIISIPVMLSYLGDLSQPLPFLIALLLSFGGLNIRKYFKKNAIQTNQP